MSNDVVWLYLTVEHPGGLDEDYVCVPRAEWDAMTTDEQNNYAAECAVDHQNNVAPCGGSVVDESEVPEEIRGADR